MAISKDVKKRVFLGGTCNESTWRSSMMTYLSEAGLSYFNPVVENWTEDCMAEEIKQRRSCDFCLYTITPRMLGVYSIAEVVDDSNKRPQKTVFVLFRFDGKNFSFNEAQWKSLNSVAQMVRTNGGQVFNDLKPAAVWMGEQ